MYFIFTDGEYMFNVGEYIFNVGKYIYTDVEYKLCAVTREVMSRVLPCHMPLRTALSSADFCGRPPKIIIHHNLLHTIVATRSVRDYICI